MAELISAGEFATEGERRAAEHLRTLPDRWVVICNKTLPTRDGRSYEIDFIIIGSRWVFVLDEKSWRGGITGNDQEWIRADGSSERSPLNKIEAVARVLAGHLRDHVPALRQERTHFVSGGILLSYGDRLPAIHRDPRVPNHVFLLDRVIEQLPTLDKQGGSSKIGTTRDTIKKTLVDLSNRSAVPKNIGIYRVEEVVEHRPGARMLRATTEHGAPRVLMVYDLGRDPTNAHSLKMFYAREFTVLQQLRSTGLVPDVSDPFPWSDDFLILPITPPAGTTLSSHPLPEIRDDLAHELLIAQACFTGLALIHNEKIVHRALGPDVIYITRSGPKPQIQFTNFFAARIGEESIALSLDLLALEDPYAAPLLAGSYGLATRETDMWSLALIFLVRLARASVHEIRSALAQRGTFPSLKSTWGSLPADIVTELDTLFQSLLRQEPDTALPAADDVARRLGELARQLKAGVPSDSSDLMLDGRYKVHRVLGRGAMACTYQATDVQTDVIVAVKQFHNAAEVYNQVKAEYQVLNKMRSKHLPNIMHVQEPEKDAHVIMEYIPGVTLEDISGEFPWRLERWWNFAQELLNAVDELEQHTMLHRDIKPANIIIHEEGGHVVLIDFGFAVGAGVSQRLAGSPLYMPPEALHPSVTTPPPTTDRYAAAVVMFKVLTSALPFNLDKPGERELVSSASIDERVQRIKAAILRAVDPDPQKRYASSKEMRLALQRAMSIAPSPEDTQHRAEMVNPWVDNLRGLYRNSGRGNADNRGMDSDFVRETYVPTALDTHLLPALLDQRPKAVFLSGNPGDGKTAFLAQVQFALQQRGAQLVQDDASGWEMHLNGHTVRSCYDASESHKGTSADEQLTARLRDLEGDTLPTAPVTVMVAINDGRLADYFTRQQPTFGWLASQIDKARYATALDEIPVWVVDLKQRAFVTLPTQSSDESVVQRVLERLVDVHQWTQCTSCIAQTACPMYANATALQNLDVRKRLEYLLLITHLRQQYHITMRDLRSALAYLITSNIACEEVHRIRNNSDAGDNLLQHAYWNIAFQPLETGDDLLASMTILDPARYAQPHLDRFLYFHQSDDDAPRRSKLFANGQDVARTHFARERDWMQAFKRRLYFEVASPSHAISSANQSYAPPGILWYELLPYEHAGAFIAALQDQNNRSTLLQTIAQGILHSDGMVGQQTTGFLTTTVTSSAEQQLVILKQLPLSEFRLHMVQPAHRAGIESIPELLVLEHTSGTPRLELTLDMFELLMRMAEGLQPDAPEFRPLLEDLAPFKSALLLQTTRDLVLIESQYRTHKITQRNGSIIRVQQSEVQV